jgi:hypothetical protein
MQVTNNQFNFNLIPTTFGTVTYTITCGNNGDATHAITAVSPPITVSPKLLGTLSSIARISTTSSPPQLDRRPYGVTIAPTTAGLITAGDVLACNFNDAANKAAQGSTLVGMHATAGASPYLIAQSSALQGCTGLAALPDGTIIASALTSAQIAFVTATGNVTTPLPSGIFVHPSGIAYAPANSQQPAALYVSDIDLSRPDGGSIYRITLNGEPAVPGNVVQIAYGFCTSGAPGALFGPSGLTYDKSSDTLYLADPSSNTIVALTEVSRFISKGGGVVGSCGGPPPTPALYRDETTPDEDSIQFIAQGAPLFTPVDVALLPNGDVVAINGDLPLSNGQRPPSPNLAIELITPTLGPPIWKYVPFVGESVQLDGGTAGALAAFAISQDSQGSPILYFSDSNTNAIMSLSR